MIYSGEMTQFVCSGYNIVWSGFIARRSVLFAFARTKYINCIHFNEPQLCEIWSHRSAKTTVHACGFVCVCVKKPNSKREHILLGAAFGLCRELHAARPDKMRSSLMEYECSICSRHNCDPPRALYIRHIRCPPNYIPRFLDCAPFTYFWRGPVSRQLATLKVRPRRTGHLHSMAYICIPYRHKLLAITRVNRSA